MYVLTYKSVNREISLKFYLGRVEKIEENNNGNVISFMKRALVTGFIWPDQVDTDTVDDDQIIKKNYQNHPLDVEMCGPLRDLRFSQISLS